MRTKALRFLSLAKQLGIQGFGGAALWDGPMYILVCRYSEQSNDVIGVMTAEMKERERSAEALIKL